MIEPFAVAANVTSRTGVFAEDVALIYGAGPVGLNLMQVLKRVYGIRAFITDHFDERLALARAVRRGARTRSSTPSASRWRRRWPSAAWKAGRR